MNERAMQRQLKRMTAAVIITGFLILAGGGIFSASLGNVLSSTLRSQMESETEEYRISISRQTEADFQTLHTLSSFLEFSNTMDTESFARGLYESNNHNRFIRMGYFPLEGDGIRVVLNGSIETGVSPDSLPDTFQETVAKAWNGESAVSDFYYDELLEDTIIAYAVPVYQNGKLTGALAASDSISTLASILDDTTVLNSQGYIHMLDGDGRFLIRSENMVIRKELDSIFDSSYIEEEEKTRIRSAMGKGQNCFSRFHYDGQDYQIYLASLGIHDWYLLCVETAQLTSTPVYSLVTATRITFIGLLALMVFLTFYGYRLLRKNNRQLISLAYYDTLTGAYNYSRFSQEIEPVIGKTTRYSIVALNIRNFKFINEIFGRNRADRLLCHISEVLEDSLSGEEAFCRDSSDLFFLFLLGTDRNVIRRRLQQIQARVAHMTLSSQRNNYPALLYCGVAVCMDTEEHRDTVSEMVTHSLFALRTAKDTPGNIWFYDQELHKTEEIENYVESHMQQALDDGEFCLYLQPKILLQNGKLGGAEALVRWIPSGHSIIYPDQFIPLFEQNGFCARLDMYMMEQVCIHLRKWHDSGLPFLPVSVNQSRLLFFETGYVESLCGLVEKYRIPPEMITLEVIEGLSMEDLDALNERISALHEKGFRISMDDFGSGYSSLNTLGSLDIDELKLDRGFLMEITSNRHPNQKIIMEEIVSLSRKLRISTVVEGVETEENEAFIRSLGCDYGQGYYYSRPVSAEEFLQTWLKGRED